MNKNILIFFRNSSNAAIRRKESKMKRKKLSVRIYLFYYIFCFKLFHYFIFRNQKITQK